MLFRKIINIPINLFYFLTTLRHGRVNWSFIAKVIINCEISTKTKLNSPCHLNTVKIDDYTYLAQNSWISHTTIGRFCSIGPNFFSGWGIHPSNGISTSPMFYSTKKQNGFTLCDKDKLIEREEIVIGNDVFIGANVTILDGVKIGDGAIIGANSIVNKNVAAYSIVGGSPAKLIKFRFSEEKIEKLLALKWWNWSFEKLNRIEKSFFDIDTFLNQNNQ